MFRMTRTDCLRLNSLCIEPSDTMRVSVVIPTRNPDPANLNRVANALALQTLPADQWEIVIVDNASTQPVPHSTFMGLRCEVRVVTEPAPGLSRARRRGVEASQGGLLAFVDDDVLPSPGFLETARATFLRLPSLGTAGGNILPEFGSLPPRWFDEFAGLLALREIKGGERILTHLHARAPGRESQGGNASHAPSGPVDIPDWLPNGAALLVRREAANAWVARVQTATAGPEITDRVGASLASGGDQDIVLSALLGGWHTGWFPSLEVTHLIPTARLQAAYLARLNQGIQRSWVHVLHRYGLNPWRPISRWTAPLRKSRAYVRSAAWKSPAHRIRWRGLCGRFDGLSDVAAFEAAARSQPRK